MKEVKLRALEPEDIDAIYAWENDQESWQDGLTRMPFSRHALSQYIAESSLLDIHTSKQLRLVAVEGGEAVGCVDLYDYEPFSQRAGIGIVVNKELRHQGYGKALLDALEDYCSRHLMLHQLYCTVSEDNIASLRLFSSREFRQVGVLKEWICTAKGYKDAVVMQKIL